MKRNKNMESNKEIDELIRDLCSVDFRAKSLTRKRVERFISEYKDSILKIGEGMRELKPKDIVSEKEIENNPELLLAMKIIRKQWLIKEETISNYQKNIKEA